MSGKIVRHKLSLGMTSFELPFGSSPLSARYFNNTINMWVRTPLYISDKIKANFLVAISDDPLTDVPIARFIDTVEICGVFWHVFECEFTDITSGDGGSDD